MTRIFDAIKRLGHGVWSLIKKWPVRAQALIVAGIALGSAFGLGWDGAQVGAVSGFSAALLAFLTEQAVTPLSEPTLAAGTQVTVTTPAGQPDRMETV
jgi:hypothetical protein